MHYRSILVRMVIYAVNKFDKSLWEILVCQVQVEILEFMSLLTRLTR